MLKGTFDFNKTPLAPPGTKIIIHEKSLQHGSWDPHGVDGWYLGPAMEHYSCYSVFTNGTQAEQVSDTVAFFPQTTTVPCMTATDIALRAANNLVQVLQHPLPATPFAQVGTRQLEALKQLADIFQHATAPRVLAPVERHSLPRVVTTPSPPTSPWPIASPPSAAPHRYPTRHVITQSTQEEASHIFTVNANIPSISNSIHQAPIQEWANSIIDPETGASLEYRHFLKIPAKAAAWTHSFANELGRLAQGVGGRLKGTNTIFFIRHDQIPTDRRTDVTYGRICVNHRPQKEEPHRTRLTVGGHPLPIQPPPNSSSIATFRHPALNTCAATSQTFIWEPPWIAMNTWKFRSPSPLNEIIEEYKLRPLAHKDHIYMEIRWGMYRLPQAGTLANNLLTQRLEPKGCYQCRHTYQASGATNGVQSYSH
jgi:hypothetical protein